MTHIIEQVIAERFGGLLRSGAHDADGRACLNEARNAALGLPWSDDPGERIDMRALNDAFYRDTLRTEHLVPVEIALWDWPDWSHERQVAWVQSVARRTIAEVLPIAPQMVGQVEVACCEREDLTVVAGALATAAARAARAAWAAAMASASEKMARAAANEVLILACRIWREAAEAA